MTRLTDNPILQVQPGGRSLNAGGTDVEFYMSVTQRIPLNGAGKKRKDSVQREVEQDAVEVEVALRDARARIAAAWFSRWTAQELEAVGQSEVALAGDLAREIQMALDAGEATHVDLGLVEGFGAEAALFALSAEGTGFDFGVELASAMGIVSEQPIATEGDLPHVVVPQEAELRAALKELGKTVNVRFARSAREAERARLAEARSAVGPQLGVGALGFREGGGDIAGVALLELVLPVFERGKRASSTATAALARAEQAERRALLDAHGERVALVHEVVHTEQVLTLTEGSLLRAAEKVAAAQKKRLDAREATTQDWVFARRAVLRARVELVHARAAYALARFRARELLVQLESRR